VIEVGPSITIVPQFGTNAPGVFPDQATQRIGDQPTRTTQLETTEIRTGQEYWQIG
jgi:hypothetical protein